MTWDAEDRRRPAPPAGVPGGAIYGLGSLGAAIYYIGHAGGFWAGVLGLLKAIIWPVFLVYEVLVHVNA